MSATVRVRFAPSPTGGLHLGGVRTVLYNYLFARQHGGQFVLRIEDTDQGRFVEGAEQYIYDCLDWCGLEPDESPLKGGPYGPYRQSERKEIYAQYARQLVGQGKAYYAFDTPEELEAMRRQYKTEETPSPQYNAELRKKMRNSLTLPPAQTEELLQAGTPHVIRILMPDDEIINFQDMIRGAVQFHSSQSDDKVLLKADGMPTYHLAVVVDDYLMKITHAFRGEEWLPSAPVHILLWKYLGWEDSMPEWAHLPLILKPDGKGKLSKRDGARLGFPVYAMDWTDPETGEVTKGFREIGFLPEAFINMLAMMGWNDGTEQELFSLPELIEKFSIERVNKSGAKFNFEKAKWFNHEWIKKSGTELISKELRKVLEEKKIGFAAGTPEKVAGIIAERCVFLSDVWPNSEFFFETPATVDLQAIQPKWNPAKTAFFRETIAALRAAAPWEAASLETEFKNAAAEKNIKPGEVLLPLRIMLVGKKMGPGVFEIAEVIGREETIRRIEKVLAQLGG